MAARGDSEHWTEAAAQWIAWARAPNHDAFWAYRDALVDYLGTGGGQALDVGCGEGRVSRILKTRGYQVTAIDPVAELLKAAVQAQSAHDYAIAPASELPFENESFDLVVAYNVLMDVVDVPGALREIRRVLRKEGTLFISIVHPLADLELLAETAPNAPSEPRATYFDRRRFETKIESRGLTMHFAGWAQPLEAYVGGLESAGFAITSLREPTADLTEGRDHMSRWSRFPLFLWLKARALAA
ncbi:SAM-dependent methyltransferase protein (plasmid) [Rhizobium gallicum]|uniref:SAM-dependent methyltransferase protein n=1 Tax=Rhizobium gallicum TaxID=56730 RepID=A0A1L5NTU0_9HYPH|nr:class I SAM-dependent methyltransferase [Rhizobium gallicum]APO71310.1 SAM-dependent methyltransferase protein [Rhizobium gallicum]